MADYIQKMRSKLGRDRFIHPAARIIIENENKEILVVKRADNGKIGLPAGAFEENETIKECIVREVREETGIEIIDLDVIGISSNPDLESVEYPNGDKMQYFTIEFYSNHWKGQLKDTSDEEVRFAQFMVIDRSCFKMEVEISCKGLEYKTKLILRSVLGKYGWRNS